MKPYAFFDYDGTLAPGDSIIAFLRYAYKEGCLHWGDLLRTIGATLLWKAGLMKDIHVKDISLRFLRRLSQSKQTQLCRDFCEQCMKPGIYPKGLAEMQRLHRQGYTLVLVTASPSVYMEYVKAFLPVDCLLATNYDAESHRITGLNCKGTEKVRRIQAMLAHCGEKMDYKNSHAYGDSLSDAPMLRLCAHRHCVNAKAALIKSFQQDPAANFENWA